MLDLGACLRYYKRPEIQKAIIEAARDREIGTRFVEGGFGKRPDVLLNNSDILENVKQNVSSFHSSEELWNNPLQIETGMRRQDLDRIRKGWDLVLDIDCPFWELSKITTWLFIEALKAHGIKSISLKFSGNKGFHIGVPFKAFPHKVPGKDILTKDYFPEGPRRIAAYLVDYIGRNLIDVVDNNIIFNKKITYSIEQLKEITGKQLDELTYLEQNGRRIKAKKKVIIKNEYNYLCGQCGNMEKSEVYVEYKACTKCENKFVQAMRNPEAKENTEQIRKKFDPLSIVEVDTILIAPRHLYRMVYSLHEKSGLSSIPIAPERILLFEKDEAKPETMTVSSHVFLDDSKTNAGEAEDLLVKSFDWKPLIQDEETTTKIKKAFTVEGVEQITQKIPEELFPPCMKLLFQPLKDGKKRALFILVNFLQSAGWNHEEISERIHAWNKIQPEQLRENIIVSHLNYHKINNKNVLPPNCPDHATVQYYRDMGVCQPDGLCRTIKNPVQYAKKRAWMLNQDLKNQKGRKKKSDTTTGTQKTKQPATS